MLTTLGHALSFAALAAVCVLLSGGTLLTAYTVVMWPVVRLVDDCDATAERQDSAPKREPLPFGRGLRRQGGQR